MLIEGMEMECSVLYRYRIFLYNSSIRLLALLMDISVLVEAGLWRVYGVLYVLHYSFQIDVLEKVVFVKLW